MRNSGSQVHSIPDALREKIWKNNPAGGLQEKIDFCYIIEMKHPYMNRQFKKCLQLLVMMFVLSVLVFSISRACPGDPLRSWYGDSLERMSSEEQDRARTKLGLKDPLPVQYARWVGQVFQGNWGISYKYKRPVRSVIGDRFGNTLLLGGISFAMTFWLAIRLGQYCGKREGSHMDRIICKLGVMTSSIPSFFLAVLLIFLFAVRLPFFPAGGIHSIGNDGVSDRIWHLVLPVTVLILGHLWYYTSLIRNRLCDELRKDYVLLCKAKGLPASRIIRAHCMKNIWPSVLTMMAVSVPHLLGGTYVVEMVFSYPGLGSLSLESAKYQDYNMLMALCLITGVMVMLFHFVSEFLSERLDPRMRERS